MLPAQEKVIVQFKAAMNSEPADDVKGYIGHLIDAYTMYYEKEADKVDYTNVNKYFEGITDEYRKDKKGVTRGHYTNYSKYFDFQLRINENKDLVKAITSAEKIEDEKLNAPRNKILSEIKDLESEIKDLESERDNLDKPDLKSVNFKKWSSNPESNINDLSSYDQYIVNKYWDKKKNFTDNILAKKNELRKLQAGGNKRVRSSKPSVYKKKSYSKRNRLITSRKRIRRITRNKRCSQKKA